MKIIFIEEARSEFLDASAYYEVSNPDLGDVSKMRWIELFIGWVNIHKFAR
jgi:hypothetical protein